MSAPEPTRLLLLRAAEGLFAERGIDCVSLREVAQVAGQKNVSATQYHFGSREGLIDAILERHLLPIRERCTAMMDLLEARGDVGLRSLAEVLVRPVVAKLDDADGGRFFLSICAQLAVSPTLPLVKRPASKHPVVVRLGSLIRPHMRADEALSPYRSERVAAMLFASLMTRARIESSSTADGVSRELFTEDLIDCATLLMRVERPTGL